MMTNKKMTKLIAMGCLSLLLQSCAIPFLNIKSADAPLPKQFEQNTDQQGNEAQSKESAALINWKDFFEDEQLTALIDTAVANNKEVKQVLARINMARNEIQARKGEYLPSVNFVAGAGGEKSAELTRNGAVEEGLEIKEGKAFPKFLGDYQFGLQASWELDVWNKLHNATQVSVLEYMASIEGKNFLMTNLVAEVSNVYYELITLDNQLENLDNNIQIQQNGYEIVQQLQQYGRVTALAVKRFEAEVSKNKSNRYAIKQQIVETENRINLLLGRTPQPIQRASATFMSITPKALSAGIPSQLLENRPDIKKAELEMAAAKLNIEVAKANFYPSFSIKAGLGFQAFNPKYLLNLPESLAFSLGGDMIAPLVNKRAITAHYKNANEMQTQAAYEYEQTVINAYTEVANQLANIDNLNKNYQLKTQQVNALTDSIEVSNQLFKAARADYSEVLLTQRDALEAKMQLIETKEKQMTAMIGLYKSLGGGWH
jgi:outer membrane protein, multidrug efflux system